MKWPVGAGRDSIHRTELLRPRNSQQLRPAVHSVFFPPAADDAAEKRLMIPRRRRIISTPINAASRFRSATSLLKNKRRLGEHSRLTQSSIRAVKRRQAKLLIKRHVPMSIVKDTRRGRDEDQAREW